VNANLVVVFCQVECKHGRRKLRGRVGGQCLTVLSLGVIGVRENVHGVVNGVVNGAV